MSDRPSVDARFITEITVRDPDTGDSVELEVWKDPVSGGLFALDATFLDQVAETIPSPFNPHSILRLREEVLVPPATRA